MKRNIFQGPFSLFSLQVSYKYVDFNVYGSSGTVKGSLIFRDQDLNTERPQGFAIIYYFFSPKNLFK